MSVIVCRTCGQPIAPIPFVGWVHFDLLQIITDHEPRPKGN